MVRAERESWSQHVPLFLWKRGICCLGPQRFSLIHPLEGVSVRIFEVPNNKFLSSIKKAERVATNFPVPRAPLQKNVLSKRTHAHITYHVILICNSFNCFSSTSLGLPIIGSSAF